MTGRTIEMMCVGLFAVGAIQAHAADSPSAKEQAQARYDATKQQLKEEHDAKNASCNSRTGGDKRACKDQAKEKYQQDLSAAKSARDKAIADAK